MAVSKILLALLLIIPSLSLGEVIPLSCGKYQTVFKNKGEFETRKEDGNYKSLYILDNILKTLFIYPQVELQLEKEYTYHYIFRDNRNSILTRAFLNKYTHSLEIEISNADTGDDVSRSSYTCEIVNKIL